LSLLDPKAAPLAYMLIERLVDEHGVRCRCGKTFALSVRAMAEEQVIPGWSWRQYTRARNLLLRVGLIELVSEYVDTAEGRVAAHFRLSEFILYPGARRGAGIVELIPKMGLGSAGTLAMRFRCRNWTPRPCDVFCWRREARAEKMIRDGTPMRGATEASQNAASCAKV